MEAEPAQRLGTLGVAPESPHSPNPRAQGQGKPSAPSRTLLSPEPGKSKQLLCDAIWSGRKAEENYFFPPESGEN